jgi:hypothetical protein
MDKGYLYGAREVEYQLVDEASHYFRGRNCILGIVHSQVQVIRRATVGKNSSGGLTIFSET